MINLQTFTKCLHLLKEGVDKGSEEDEVIVKNIFPLLPYRMQILINKLEKNSISNDEAKELNEINNLINKTK